LSASPGAILAILLVAMSGAAPAGEYTEVQRTPADVKRGDECDRLHQQLRQEHADNRKALRDAWAASKKQCGGTGIYELLLGVDERNAGNADEAMRVLDDSVEHKLPYYEQGFVILSVMRFDRAKGAGDMAVARAVRDELAQFAAAHQPDDFAYQQLADLNVGLKDWPAAVVAAQKSIALNPANARAHRQLVVALHADNRCVEAVPRIRPAVESNRELLGELGFMLSAADCYFETGDLKNGVAAMGALLHANPEVKDDPNVVQLLKYAAAKGQPIPAPQ